MHLNQSLLSRIVDSTIGSLFSVGGHSRPAEIRAVSRAPVFGLDLYRALGTAKIVLNGAIDMAGDDRGNMRCFEALGGRSVLLSDAGKYPRGMTDGVTMMTYTNAESALSCIGKLLDSSELRQSLADAGNQMVRQEYSKAQQFRLFQELVT
jgi:spore maturation protein CgeB